MSISSMGDEPICPRCRSTDIAVISRSPIKGVWTVHGCKVCLYAWRDTEPEENRNPDLYPEPFRLKPEDVRNFPVVPTIPALRRKRSDE
jgi:vanillate/4-hydroxybenzoate decarboxylase subunit D